MYDKLVQKFSYYRLEEGRKLFINGLVGKYFNFTNKSESKPQ
jgi:hypothetical protein